jgi:hypothetical protein
LSHFKHFFLKLFDFSASLREGAILEETMKITNKIPRRAKNPNRMVSEVMSDLHRRNVFMSPRQYIDHEIVESPRSHDDSPPTEQEDSKAYNARAIW